jgi:lipopolysaccharide transport system permease protein
MTAFVLGYQDILLKGEWPPLYLWGVISVWLGVAYLALMPVLRHSRDQLVDWL